MVTIKDVAQDAGVSVGTVSKVLNNIYVTAVYKEKVEQSIKRLGYQVNTYARGLKAQRTNTVAIIVPDLISPFFALLVNYVEQALAEINYKLLICNSHCKKEKEFAYINMAKQNKVDGLICVTYSNSDEYLSDDLPIISIDRHFKSKVCCVASDNYYGGKIAAEKLIETGCKNIIYIRNGSTISSETLKRGQGFMDACKKTGIDYCAMEFGEETTLEKGGETEHKVCRFLEECMNHDKFVYDGIFASSDSLGQIIIEKLKQMGLNIPMDVQVIGYDGLRALNVGAYQLSSIKQPVKDMAFTCVNHLMKLINKETIEDLTILPVSFVDGGTTR
ncbi:LacI family DNA-binding transcriptional regulator [Anaerocolumna sp. MB42-C2]|uniref:LacI family DNA-binding transcriptional regulator n=1 Tax=Anaerocolumna sp. MB42-C2 TaxID=3070997 RepID=UPI0027E08E81|nr:LacI family DNA-binding transcriptional regulator [Anaerocolumna sp. MB42-C2]WMJ89023.1 LacI family DNA-binding transcriptional regulator [Anaerocolumna sp. MB42-C2]